LGKRVSRGLDVLQKRVAKGKGELEENAEKEKKRNWGKSLLCPRKFWRLEREVWFPSRKDPVQIARKGKGPLPPSKSKTKQL